MLGDQQQKHKEIVKLQKKNYKVFHIPFWNPKPCFYKENIGKANHNNLETSYRNLNAIKFYYNVGKTGSMENIFSSVSSVETYIEIVPANHKTC